MNKKIAFFGTFGEFSRLYLDSLKNAGFNIALAVEDKKIDFRTIEQKLLETKPDLGVIAYFGKIIPKNILKIPAKGFINAHPSLLPRWRGPSPVQNTILAGDTKTGITIHITSEEIDEGDILAQKEVPIFSNDTCGVLTERLAKEGAKLLPEVIESWLNRTITPTSQNHSLATHSKMIKKEDGLIDWSKTPEYIERQVRAYDPWPGTFTKMKNGKILKIKKVETKNGKLKILVVQPEGKKDMPYEAFLRGHPDFKIYNAAGLGFEPR
ncbi:MAG: methionyl-tRNA formyltransferase [Patescibacteria group bacterium]